LENLTNNIAGMLRQHPFIPADWPIAAAFLPKVYPGHLSWSWNFMSVKNGLFCDPKSALGEEAGVKMTAFL